MRSFSHTQNLYYLLIVSLLFSCKDDNNLFDGKAISYEVMCSKSGDSAIDYRISSWTWTTPINYLESYNDNDYTHICNWNQNILYTISYAPQNISLPRDCYKSVSLTEGQYTCTQSEVITDSIFRIGFQKENCIVSIHAVRCLLNKGQSLNCKQYVYLFNEGRYKINNSNDYFLITEKEAKMISAFGQVKYSIPLNNYQGIIVGKCDYTKIIERPVDTNEVFEYTIDGDYVLLSQNKTLYKKIRLDNNILSND